MRYPRFRQSGDEFISYDNATDDRDTRGVEQQLRHQHPDFGAHNVNQVLGNEAELPGNTDSSSVRR
ncbi:hypothetical protein [Pedobacter jamesrossensis]|uniref:Uncharacterized protein n=1 Tax=Pedobacter jamesrossensis TaxID=1908238 RepID=A0ABV8NJA2_9SPHI